MQLWQMRNKRNEEYWIIVARNWHNEDEIRDIFFRKGVDLTGYEYVRGIALLDGDLDVKPGDWTKR